MKEKSEAENYTAGIISQLAAHGMHMWKVMPSDFEFTAEIIQHREKQKSCDEEPANKWKIFRKIKNSLNLWQESKSGKTIKVKKEGESEVTQSCPTLCDPVDCDLPGSSGHGILQASILEWVAISFSRGSSRPRDWTWVSRLAGRHFNLWTTREAQNYKISI